MFHRLASLNKTHSFFLFGARGTGKSTLIERRFRDSATLWIDLLTARDESAYRSDPDLLLRKIGTATCVVIDEIQKLPKLLDVVQIAMGKHKKCQFILTGSSARKLKRGGANLLAGRAFTYHLFPLTHTELGDHFELASTLTYGSLPRVFELPQAEDRNEFLRSYVETYLKEEVLLEQLVRQVDPFRDFLPVAAQHNGQVINYSAIGRDVGIDDKTVRTFFQILEDTLLGFLLPPFHRSVRKRQRLAPKFYLFDLGVKRAMDGSLGTEVSPSTFGYGQAFEHFVICEVVRLNEYTRGNFRLSYLRTKDNAEIDLIIERPRQRTLLVEIKSALRIHRQDLSGLSKLLVDWPTPAEAQVWSRDETQQTTSDCQCLPWIEGLKRLSA